MIEEDFEVIDDFLEQELHHEVCEGVKSLYALFLDSDFNGNEFISLGTPEKLRDKNMKTMPRFLRKYLDKVINKEASLFFQNVLYIRHMKSGIPWHVDSQIKDRIEESGLFKRVSQIQGSVPDIDLICVYYPFVPKSLEGGTFKLKSQGKEFEVDIVPNRMIRIKGNIEHCTDPIKTNGQDYRISMVTEQIKLPSIFERIINKKDFLYDGIFDDVIIKDSTGHYLDWKKSGSYENGKYVEG